MNERLRVFVLKRCLVLGIVMHFNSALSPESAADKSAARLPKVSGRASRVI